VTRSHWRVRLGAEAEKDFVRILKYTADTFGERQAATYQTTLIDALTALHSGPDVPASASRDEILPGLRSLHIARQGRPGRHFIICRALGGEAIEVVRILHDAMELACHIPTESA
jgi:toxin ParE1/3/4